MKKDLLSLKSECESRRNFLKGTLTLPAAAALAQANALCPNVAKGADPASALEEVAVSPYGVCAHIGGGEEWEQAPKNLELMKAAGIRWVRADFSWIGVEREEGKWRFDHLDAILDKTTALGMQILPILDYTVPWASPSWKHMDAWLEYVRRVVERYHDRIKYWEVWNEENLKGFWADEPNAENYAMLLRETYKTIKKIDPSLTVLYGGLAGVPADYFAKSLDAGAGDFFDVVNIHPYRGALASRDRIDRFQSDIEAFRVELKKRNLKDRPIWITEMGWATPPVFGEANRRVIAAGLERLCPNRTPKVAFFFDSRYEPSATRSTDDFRTYLPKEYAENKDLVSFLDADALKKITPQTADALIMPPGETFPEDCLDAMLQYVKDGGILFLLGGVPLYYSCTLDEKGEKYVRQPNNPNFGRDINKFRIGWYAWWTKEGTPEEAPAVVASEALDFNGKNGANALRGYNPVVKTGRFFSADALKEGDRLIPLINGEKDDFRAPAACIYDFNSDYRGALVVSSIMGGDGMDTNVATVANQAVFLPQAYLLAFAFGVERYFWYEFHAPERDEQDPEHHFGIVGQKLDPKPAYYAYKALTNARPAGSKEDALTMTGENCVRSWIRQDGIRAWAIWSCRTSLKAKITITGRVDAAFDYLGNSVEIPRNGSEINLAPGVLYLLGPDKIEIK